MDDTKLVLSAIVEAHNMKTLESAVNTVNGFLECGAVVFVKTKGNSDLVKLEQIDTSAIIMPFV